MFIFCRSHCKLCQCPKNVIQRIFSQPMPRNGKCGAHNWHLRQCPCWAYKKTGAMVVSAHDKIEPKTKLPDNPGKYPPEAN